MMKYSKTWRNTLLLPIWGLKTQMSNNENKLTKWIVGPLRRASRSKRKKSRFMNWLSFFFYFVFLQSNLAVLSPLHFSCCYTTIPLNTLIQLAIKWNPHFFIVNLDSNKCEILLCFSSWFLSQVTRLVVRREYFGTKLSTYEWTHARVLNTRTWDCGYQIKFHSII